MKTLAALRKFQAETKAEVFIVGGFVRDMLRNKTNDDLDIVIKGITAKEALIRLKKYGKVKTVNLSRTNDKFGVSIMLFKGNDNMEAQISLARRGDKQVPDKNNTLTQDVAHRDFTINGLYLPIDKFDRDKIIDTVGGIHDIKNKVIRTIGNPDERLIESPVRILRTISIAARTGYKINNALREAIKRNIDLLYRLPTDNVRNELDKIMLSKKPSIYFKLMNMLGILKVILPEVYACVGCDQEPKYHKFNVFNHCIYTMDNIERDLVLRYAALLHDVGKPPTRRKINGRITFHKHEMVGVRLAKTILTRLGHSNIFNREVITLVRNHMYHYTREWTDGALRRFIKRINIDKTGIKTLDTHPLFKLRMAERLGNGFKKEPVTNKQRDFQNRIVKVFNASNGLEVKELDIDGKALMMMFRLPQGKVIGEILNHLLSLVLEKPELNHRTELLKLTVEYLDKPTPEHGECSHANL